MPDFVKLVNNGDKPFDFQQNNQKRIIESGEDVIVPWNIAATLFGDPNIPDIPPVNERSRMYAKLRARYNFGAGLMSDDDWDRKKPNVKVFDLETNSEIIMLLDDPKGEHMGTFTPSKAPSKQTDVDAMQRQIAALTAQVERLVNQQVASPSEASGSGTSNSPTVTADGPGQDAPGSDIDPVFDLPTATDDDPQATPVGEIEEATEDGPRPAKKVAAKKVAAKK